MNKTLAQYIVIKPALKINLPFVNNGRNTLNIKARQIHSQKSTVDVADVERHSQQAKEWWDPNGSMNALHSFNLLRVPFIRDGLIIHSAKIRTNLPLMNKTILDVGCGGGILSEALARIGATVTGIDASKELIEIAEEHSHIDPKISDNRPCYICDTIEQHWSSHPNHYDALVASEIIEHVNNKELFVKSCVHAVKPGGKLFFTTPNRTRLSQVLGICMAEYVFNIVPKGTHQYDKFVTPTELTFLLERNNCHVQAIYGTLYSPFSKRWSWIESQALMYAVEAVKCEDDKENAKS